MSDEPKKDLVKRFLRSYDWPEKGIVFRDISPLLKEPAAFAATIDLFEDYVKRHHREAELIAGVDARGFVFGAVLAQRLGKGFLMLRKKGKLPGPTMSVSYTLEYGQAELEVQADAVDRPGQKVLIVDDILATGGTMAAACELMAKQQAEVLACLFVVELKDLNGAQKVPHTCYSIIQYGGLLNDNGAF